MKSFLKVMKALSDPSRVKIMKMLQRREMCVCEIHTSLGFAQSTASKHLKILEEAGLITFYKDGLWVTRATGSSTPPIPTGRLIGGLKHWLEDDPAIKALMGRLPEIQREHICGR